MAVLDRASPGWGFLRWSPDDLPSMVWSVDGDRAGPLSQIVSGEVRAWMSRTGIRQTQVAAALGISRQSVSLRLTGRTAWTVDDVSTVAELLGVPVADLLTPPRQG